MKCTVCGAADFEVISQEMIEKIAAVEGGLQEETTYDGRKLRWSEDARKGLWTMKNAYQRRRVKARVEKRARMMKLDAITLDFARQVIEEETGTPLDIQSPPATTRRRSACRAPATPAHRRNATAQPTARPGWWRATIGRTRLISTFDWTERRRAARLRVPAGFMRNKTQERIEELAREREAATIDLALVEDGIEIGKRMMAEMISTYTPPGAGTAPGPDHRAARPAPPPQCLAPARDHAGSEPGATSPQWTCGRADEFVPLLPDRRHRPARRRAEPLLGSGCSHRTARDACGVQAVDPRPAGLVQQLHGRLAGAAPIAVLIGAKRPTGTLVHTIAVHPDHRRQGHGRHLLTSLASKLAILGPPRLVAELPETLVDACGLFKATGYVQEVVLTDYVFERDGNASSEGNGGRLIPVTMTI